MNVRVGYSTEDGAAMRLVDKHWPSVFTMLFRRLLSPSYNGRVDSENLVHFTAFEAFYWINA